MVRTQRLKQEDVISKWRLLSFKRKMKYPTQVVGYLIIASDWKKLIFETAWLLGNLESKGTFKDHFDH